MQRDGIDPVTILIATPFGRGGEGGIDRLMDAISNALDADPPQNLRIIIASTRGHAPLFISPLYLVVFILRMWRLKLIGRCNLVHINLAISGSTIRKLALMRVARALRIPYVVHLHGSAYAEYFAKVSPLLQRQIVHGFDNAARVIVLGAVWREFVIQTLGVSPGRVTILQNAVPAPQLGRKPDRDGKVRILFLGQLGARKGTHILVEALKLLEYRPGWRAVLAGDGEIEKTRSALKRAGLETRVEVPGWLGPAETAERLANSDILVLPSFAENLPMSVIEGMAAGLGVVATPVGATAEIIVDGETGLLVPPGDTRALAAALAGLIKDGALRDRLGEAAQRYHRRNLEIGVYARRLCSLWREAAQ
jgi:glycosyltransferase involved in cell wall biosynthesis